METGKPQTYQAGDELRFYDQNHVAPCKTGWTCPKVSPEQEHEFVLSSRNDKVVRLYHRVRIVGSQAAGDKIDPLLAEVLSLCDQVYNGWERDEDDKRSAQLMVAVGRSLRMA